MLEISSNNSFLLPNNKVIDEAMKNHNDGQSIIQINLLSYRKIAKYEDESLTLYQEKKLIKNIQK